MNNNKTLKENTIGLWSSIAMGIAGTAPAFSIETATSTLILAVGVLSPATILYCGILMLGVAFSFAHLSKIEANAGASFTWVSKIFGTNIGFMSGWTLLVASSLFMVSATIPASNALLLIFSPELINNIHLIALISFLLFTIISLIIVKGIHLSSRIQTWLVLIETIILGFIAIATYFKFRFNPLNNINWESFSLSSFTPSTFIAGATVGLFFYWGWDVILNLSEETKDKNNIPAKSTIITMMILIFIFLSYIFLILISLSPQEIELYNTNVIYALADKLYGGEFALLAIAVVLLSTIGTIETQILQFSRTLFAQSREGIFHHRYSKIHDKWQTPHIAIITVWIIGSLFIFLSSYTETIKDLLNTLISSIGFQIAFYLGLTCLACAWHFRDKIKEYNSLKNIWNIISHIIYPLISAGALIFITIYSAMNFDMKTNILGLGGILIGIIPLILYKWRRRSIEI